MINNMSFKLKLIFGVVLIEIILVCSLITIDLNKLRNSNENELRIRANNIAEILAVSTKDAVLATNVIKLKQIISEVNTIESIDFVNIYSTKNKLAMAKNMSDDNSLYEHYKVRHDIINGRKIIGHVEIGVSTSHIELVMSQAYKVAYSISIIGVLLSIVFSWLLGSYLTSRLTKLRIASKNIADGKLGYQLDITGGDELGQTSQAFNDMSSRVKQLYDELNDSLEKTQLMSNVINESEIYTSAVLNSVTDAIISTNKEGNIETVNKAIVEIFGYDFNDLIGENITILIPASLNTQQDDYISEYNKLYKNGCSKSTLVSGKRNFQARHKDGVIFPVEVTIKPIEINKELIFVALITDITSRKLVEDEMICAREDAELANRSKSEFLANMSHEIRTPMNGVIGMLQVLDKTQLDTKQRKFVGTAVSSAHLLLHIINDILDFSKIESGKFKLDCIDFNIRKIVEDTTEILNQTVHSKPVKILNSISESIPECVLGDPSRLTQILMNLGGNAIKFTEVGEIVIRVELKQSLGERYYLNFEVKDSGIGIAAEHSERLFKPFQQADGSTSRRFGGTGLGLSICKYLVELMDGEIGLISQPGEGSTFWFNIYLDHSENTNILPIKQLENKHVLVASDNEKNLELMYGYLKAVNVTVHKISDGVKALERIEKLLIHDQINLDAIILDLKKPILNGIEVARKIYKNAKFSSIPMMLISSLESAESIPLDSGIKLCLSTPLEQQHFTNYVSKLIYNEDKLHAVEATSLEETSVVFNTNILLVEDNIINQEVAFEMLKLLGISPVLAENGIEAVETFKINDFDLILMDCQMPVMDGYKATQLIRDYELHEKLKRTPVIALTANAMASDKKKCIDAGMDDHIPKPITDEYLKKVLSNWLIPETAKHGDEVKMNVANTDSNSNYTERQYIDEKMYNDMYNKLGDRYLSIIEKFKENGLQLIDNIISAVTNNDIDSIKLYSHTLKGSSDSMAASLLCELASKIEQKAKNSDLSTISELTDELHQIYHETFKIYERLNNDHRKSA